MRGNRARRALLVALTVCLALLVVNYARRSVDAEMNREERFPRQNNTLSLELGKDGIIRIDGEGKLFNTDFKSLLEENGIGSKTVKHVLIGDGITEIGYDVLSNRRYLITLKLGRNVRRVSAGGIKNCISLQYIYLPSGLQDIAGDFLYNCGQCGVITDGAAADLPHMANLTEDAMIYEHVDSLEALMDAVENELDVPSALKHWWD